MKKWGIFLIALIAAILIYTQLTLFIVPPIGAVPEGKTVVILRLNKTNFIDSPDAMCERLQGGVNLLCRGVMLGGVLNKSKIIMRLPYSETLYLLSTNGKTYRK
ncbi:hypothetical protein SAMN05660420_03366 [Desulfuromusa kysingii]|uniref:Uncharacterized protein n=1 Tax=Desulfuromusa kysingii TaxID=37625 RepID=A0A1H4EFN0_9BACT|nr:hypothetical protein [Desulfuromusa kysingii]SEA83871.1 hypothetical protein SAMN05660420_03366 [Desulfuromusa kysingii]